MLALDLLALAQYYHHHHQSSSHVIAHAQSLKLVCAQPPYLHTASARPLNLANVHKSEHDALYLGSSQTSDFKSQHHDLSSLHTSDFEHQSNHQNANDTHETHLKQAKMKRNGFSFNTY